TRASRDAWLAGWLSRGAKLQPGSLAVREGRVLATLPEARQPSVAAGVADLVRDDARTFALEAKATEVTKEELTTILAEIGSVEPQGGFRVGLLYGPEAARFEERLRPLSDPRGLFSLDARVAARHTQLVTARSVRARSVVEDFR